MQVSTSCPIVEKKFFPSGAIYMTLEVGDMVRSSFRAPGQFVHIKCGEGLLLRRPISVCMCQQSQPSDLISIVFEIRGEGTSWLAARQVGEKLDVMGLLGNGFFLPQGKRYLLVGGGIGVPPLLGCAQHFGGANCTAILGFRSKGNAILTHEFESLCAKTTLASDDGTLGFHGFVDTLVQQELSADRGYDAILACGPHPMLKSVAKVAAQFALPCYVSMEARMGCGIGACLVCSCDMADGTRSHVCKNGPVFDAQEVDWNA